MSSNPTLTDSEGGKMEIDAPLSSEDLFQEISNLGTEALMEFLRVCTRGDTCGAPSAKIYWYKPPRQLPPFVQENMSSRKRKKKTGKSSEFEEAFESASKKSKSSKQEREAMESEVSLIGMYDLPPEVILNVVTAGKFDPNLIARLSRVDKRFASIFQDPQTRRDLCRQFQRQFSMLKTPEQITAWLRREIEAKRPPDNVKISSHRPISILFGRRPDDKAITAFMVMWGNRSGVDEPYLDFWSAPVFRFALSGDNIVPSLYYGMHRLTDIEVTLLSSEDAPAFTEEDFWNHVMEYFMKENYDIQFGTKLINQKPKSEESIKRNIHGSASSLWFDKQIKDRFVLSEGTLVDESGSQHPYCRDLLL